jgi:hypothetical protein
MKNDFDLKKKKGGKKSVFILFLAYYREKSNPERQRERRGGGGEPIAKFLQFLIFVWSHFFVRILDSNRGCLSLFPCNMTLINMLKKVFLSKKCFYFLWMPIAKFLATVLCPGFFNNLEKFSKIGEMGIVWYYN